MLCARYARWFRTLVELIHQGVPGLGSWVRIHGFAAAHSGLPLAFRQTQFYARLRLACEVEA